MIRLRYHAIGRQMLTLRPATLDDARNLWLWRNDPATRGNSITTDEVPWESHVRWLEASLGNPERTLLVAETDAPVGTVRIDAQEISWTVAPEARGKGIAKAMVAAASSPGMVAMIKQVNTASQRVAESAGFALVVDGELQRWERH